PLHPTRPASTRASPTSSRCSLSSPSATWSTPSSTGRPAGRADGAAARNLVAIKDVTPKRLRDSVLFGLAKQMGQEMAGVRGHALRQSARMEPSTKYLAEDEFQEPHRRGEILVAAMMNAFIEVWAARLKSLGTVVKGHLDRGRVIEEGANAADY